MLDTLHTVYYANVAAELASRFFEKGGWIDAGRGSKASTRPCPSDCPPVYIYILLNYDSKARDVMTLAHELQITASTSYWQLTRRLLMSPNPLTLLGSLGFCRSLVFRHFAG